jgi:putative transposase
MTSLIVGLRFANPTYRILEKISNTMQYRRALIPGGRYFFTLVTQRRRPIFVDEVPVEKLRQALRQVMRKRPFFINAAVILPDHLHCIWTLPPDDADFSTRWRLIKTWFTKHYENKDQIENDVFTVKPSEPTIWQHRYWEHVLRNEWDFEQHVDYIHYNPVKHGYVNKPADWKYSSFHHYVKQGMIPHQWGESDISFPDGVGNE